MTAANTNSNDQATRAYRGQGQTRPAQAADTTQVVNGGRRQATSPRTSAYSANETVVAPGAVQARLRQQQAGRVQADASQSNPYGATRSYRPTTYGQAGYAQSPAAASTAQDAPVPEKKGIFGDLSGAQVIATALAAVTSTFLSSQIGIVGGLIGVGLGAAASAIVTSLYKTLISRSAEKLKNLGQKNQEQIAGVMDSSELDDYEIGPDGTRIASESMREAASQQDKRQKRIAVIIATVAAIAAVAIGAAVINTATAGNGLGTKTTFVASAPTQEETDSKTTDEAADTKQDAATTDDTSSTDSSTSTDKSSSGTSSSTSTKSSTSDSTSSSSKNSGTSTSGSSDTTGTNSSSNSGSTASSSDTSSKKSSSDTSSTSSSKDSGSSSSNTSSTSKGSDSSSTSSKSGSTDTSGTSTSSQGTSSSSSTTGSASE